MKLSILIFVIVALTFTNSYLVDKLWPLPTKYSYNKDGDNITASPCNLRYVVQSPGKPYIEEIIKLYQTEVFKCSSIKEGDIIVNIVVRSANQFVATDVQQERYNLIISNPNRWELSADYYPGFLRGFQTFSQLFQKNENDQYQILGIPISIEDVPSFIWRALMIDTSRHFLQVSTIKKAIDAMMFSKLNVLHWHITDEDAFPMFVPTVPELSGSGSIGGVYSQNDLKTIIAYARARGIRVVPQIDTPAHSESWGRSEKYKEITLNCNGLYEGQLDPTSNLTWEVLTKVLTYVNTTFGDDYVHFGGDQVEYNCWGKKDSIVAWMKDNNIASFKDLTIYFRQQQKKLWRSINDKRKVIYWANEGIDLPVQDDDVIHWWGVSSNVNKLVGRKNQVILSNYDVTYLDIGFGNFYGGTYSTYQSWRKAYSYEPRVKDVNVIGGASCMWNQIGNDHTFQQKVTQRSSVIGERLWNPDIDLKTQLNNIATRLNAHSQRLRQRGFKVWPVTVGVCENEMSVCF